MFQIPKTITRQKICNDLKAGLILVSTNHTLKHATISTKPVVVRLMQWQVDQYNLLSTKTEMPTYLCEVCYNSVQSTTLRSRKSIQKNNTSTFIISWTTYYLSLYFIFRTEFDVIIYIHCFTKLRHFAVSPKKILENRQKIFCSAMNNVNVLNVMHHPKYIEIWGRVIWCSWTRSSWFPYNFLVCCHQRYFVSSKVQ
jgi:hypothetical protein